MGDVLAVLGVRLDAKETQPPSRYGQGPLIEKMEELDLGTKATRADIIQHLYDRNYVRDNPVEPTELGIAVIRAFDAAMTGAPLDISSPAMTARLEDEMDRITLGDLRSDRVVSDSQELLAQAHKLLENHIEAIRTEIKGAVREDMTLGVCANCGGELRILRGKTRQALRGLRGQGGRRAQGARRRARRHATEAWLRPDVPAAPAGCYHRQRDHLPRVRLARDHCAQIGRPRATVAALSGSRLSHQGEVQEAGDLAARLAGRGFFVTLEGIDRSGKTTQVERLCASLGARGLPVGVRGRAGGLAARARRHAHRRGGPRACCCTVPTTSPPGPRRCSTPPPAPSSCAELVRPSLQSGLIVVLDRYIDSSLAYQGCARGLGIDAVLEVNERATGGLLPDLTVLLRVDPDRAARRPGGPPDRLEAEGRALQARVAAGYDELARRYPERIVALDGQRPADAVAADVEAATLAALAALPIPAPATAAPQAAGSGSGVR